VAAEVQNASEFAPLFQTALGGILAIVGGVVAVFVAEVVKHRAERRRMASAFCGEIKAILEIARVRRFREVLEGGQKLYASGRQWASWSWPITENYFGVYKGNVDRIGLFNAPIPEKIATFYTLCFGLVEDLKSLGKDGISLKDSNSMLQFFSEDLGIISTVEKLGSELIEALGKAAR
jgi:hypothetical protein